jgi:hypothetical protein
LAYKKNFSDHTLFEHAWLTDLRSADWHPYCPALRHRPESRTVTESTSKPKNLDYYRLRREAPLEMKSSFFFQGRKKITGKKKDFFY